jgi:hypothetical protein
VNVLLFFIPIFLAKLMCTGQRISTAGVGEDQIDSCLKHAEMSET